MSSASVLIVLHRYASVEAGTKAGIDVPLPACWSQIEVENWLIVHATAVNSGKPIQVDEDVFEQGFDRRVAIYSHYAVQY